MNRNPFLSISDTISFPAFWIPRWLKESAWIKGMPFAIWTIDLLQAKMFAEPGTDRGNLVHGILPDAQIGINLLDQSAQ
jgi:hypothetical protein